MNYYKKDSLVHKILIPATFIYSNATVNTRNTRKMCQMCSKLTIKAPKLMTFFVPNCREGVKLQILGKKTSSLFNYYKKTPLKHPTHPTPPILRNLNNFPPGAFYSTTPTIRRKRVTFNMSYIFF